MRTRTVDHAALGVQVAALAAVARVTGALLLVDLRLGEVDLGAGLRVVRATALGGALRTNDLPQEVLLHFGAEHRVVHLEGADGLAGEIDDVELRHGRLRS